MTAQTILPANSVVDSGFNVANSVRYNDGDSPHLNINFGSDGTLNKWTFSMWFKRSTLGTAQRLFCVLDSGIDDYIKFGTDDKIEWGFDHEDSNRGILITNRVFRDVSAWYHLVCRLDTTNGTAGDRMRMYINGVEETSFATDTNPPEDATGDIGRDNNHYIGSSGSSQYFDGYFAEVCMINNQSLAPTSFGEFDEDSGIWKPIDVSDLTPGTNGFYLDFEASDNLGNDAFGGTDWGETNLAATDQTTDTCTNNFATMNNLETSPYAIVFSQGNTEVVGSGGNGGRITLGTIAPSSGKWWCEVKMLNVVGSYPIVGIIDSQSSLKMDAVYFVDSGQDANNRSGYALFSNSDVYNNGDNNFGDFVQTYTTNDIIGVGLDMDASTPTLTFQKNGSSEKTFTTEIPPSGFYNFPAIGFYFAAAKVSVNFGNPSFSISSGNTDGNGYGNMEYAVPSGYYSLNTKNLAEFT